jgi:hypothetical protein
MFCINIDDPVCGCNGVTWDNACVANAGGFDVLHKGMCP